MTERKVWNLIKSPKTKFKDKSISEKVKTIMSPYILPDDVVYRFKHIFQNEISLGLSCPDQSTLPMAVTFITERFTESEGEYISICVQLHLLTVTLIRMNPDAPHEVQKKDYNIDASVYKQPYKKIYEFFSECVKEFFYEFNLDGKTIPAGFCTDLYMEQLSLDTAVIPYFTQESNFGPCQKDVKMYFEHILCKEAFQGKPSYLMHTSPAVTVPKVSNSSTGIYQAQFEAKFLGTESILGLEVNFDLTHKTLAKMKALIETGKSMKYILVEISHTCIKIQDKGLKDILYQHPLNKISHITQDLSSSNVFGYVFGDYLKGHQFFGFKTEGKSAEIVIFLKEVFQMKLIQKKKEELNLKASQVFITLKGFLNLAQELKVREREIPSTLKKRVKLVEDICWWLERSSEDITPTVIEPEKSELNVKIQKLYSTAIEMKLIEKEKEEEAIREQDKADKKHRRRKMETDNKRTDHPVKNKLPLHPSQVKVSLIVEEHLTYFQSTLENRKCRIEMLKEQELQIEDDKLTDCLVQEAFSSLKKFYTDSYEEFNTELETLKEKIDSLIFYESTERLNLQQKGSSIHIGKKQHLRTVQRNPDEPIFEHFDSQMLDEPEEKSEISQKIKIYSRHFLTALRMRREEVEQLNYFISELHFRGDRLTMEESIAVVTSRKLLVRAVKMRLKEIEDMELALKELSDVEESITFAVPDTLQLCKNVYENVSENLKEKNSFLEKALSEFSEPSETNILWIQVYKNQYCDLKNLIIDEIGKVEQEISRIQTQEHALNSDVSATCFKLYTETVENRKKEFDALLNNLDLLHETEIVYLDNRDIQLIANLKDIFLASIVIREKEIDMLEKEIRIDDFKIEKDSEVIVTLKDLFYAAIELEKRHYEDILQVKSDEKNNNEVFPVVFCFKDMFNAVAQMLKKKQIEESGDSTSAKNLELHTSLGEFLSMAFHLKQKEIEVPLNVLKQGLEKIISSMIKEVKNREILRILAHNRHNQALKILISWKELFVTAADFRRSEVMEVFPAKVKELKEEEAAIRALKSDERSNAANEGIQMAVFWRKIISKVIDLKRKEIETIKQLVKDPKNFSFEEKVEEASSDTKNREYFLTDENDTVKGESNTHSEILRAVCICKQIFELVIEKSTLELDEMEHEIRPLFNPDYDEEIVELEEDEITTALNISQHILQTFYKNSTEFESDVSTIAESLTFIQENIKSQVSSAKESSKQYLEELLEIEESEIKFIENNTKILEDAFEGLATKPTQEFRPLTGLTVDVLSSEKEIFSIEEQEQQKKSEDPIAPKLTREQIDDLIREIYQELNTGVDEEEEDEDKLKALDIFYSCKKFLKSAVEFRLKNIQTIKEELGKFELPKSKKKMKAKKKMEEALSSITICKDIFVGTIEVMQFENKFMLHEMDKMTEAHTKEQEDVKFKPSEIVGDCRKLFSSFVDARKRNISLMESELIMLRGKEESLNIDGEIKIEESTALKSEIFPACKELVIGSVNLKMKEIDSISSQLDVLNKIEQNIESLLEELNTVDMKAAYTELEKVKDSVSTCKKLCVFAIEKAKGGVKDANEELKMLREIIETNEGSLVTTTCVQLLQSSIEEKKQEILVLQQTLDVLKTSAAKVDETEIYLQSDIDDQDNPEIIQRSKELQTEKAEEFLKNTVKYFQFKMTRRKKQIHSIKSGIDKLKVTVQKVENEDSQVFDICHYVILSTLEKCREEIKSIEGLLKALSKINIEEISTDTDSEVEFVTSYKRSLQSAMKARRSKIDVVEFELMKIVRYQDSRLSRVCKDLLLTVIAKSNEEMEIIKEMKEKVEKVDDKYELLDLCRHQCYRFIQMLNMTVQKIESALQATTEAKIKIEVEDSQFVSACKGNFIAQIAQRKREISLLSRELDAISELQTNQNPKDGVKNALLACEKLSHQAKVAQESEIENIECELIKKSNIKVADAVADCEKNFWDAIEIWKMELFVYREALENVQEARENFWSTGKDEVFSLATRFENVLSSVTQECNLKSTVLQNDFRTLMGKPKISKEIEEIKMDNVSDQVGSKKKLQTEASSILTLYKANVSNIIANFNDEVDSMKLAVEELKSNTEPSTPENRKPLSETFSPSGRYTAKQLALLDDLDEDNYHAETLKIQFCEQLYLTSIDRKEELIKSLNQSLVKFSIEEDNVISEAAQLIYAWKNLFTIALDNESKENEVLLKKIFNLKEIKEAEQEMLLGKLEEMLAETIKVQEATLGQIISVLEGLKEKDTAFKQRIYCTFTSSQNLLDGVVKVLEDELKLSLKSVDGLKVYIDDTVQETEDSSLSFDDKIVKSCRRLALTSIENTKKCLRAINLEMKTREVEKEIEKSSVLPSWCDRFLTFIGMAKDEFTTNQDVLPGQAPHAGGISHQAPQVCSSSKTARQSSKQRKLHKLIMYKDLLKAMEHKKLKQPTYCISTWNDILFRSYLIEELETAQKGMVNEFSLLKEEDMNLIASLTNISQKEFTWDELLMSFAGSVSNEKKLSKSLQRRKKKFLPLSSWTDIFTTATESWKAQISKSLNANMNEKTLLQWKERMKPKEYMEFVAGYFYDAQDPKLMEMLESPHDEPFTGVPLKPLDLSLDLETLMKTPCLNISESTSDNSQELSELLSWEDLFEEAVLVIEEGNKMVGNLKKQDLKVQHQVARIHSTWNDYFIMVIKNEKDDLKKIIKENSKIEELAKSANEMIQSGLHEAKPRLKAQRARDSWTEKIFEVYKRHQKELMDVMAIKKQEIDRRQSTNKVSEFESKTEDNLLLETEPRQFVSRGRRMFSIALDLQKADVKSKTVELCALKNAETHLENVIPLTSKSINNWKKIVSSAVDYKKKGLQLEQETKKRVTKSPEELFFAVKSKIMEVESGINLQMGNQEKVLFNLGQHIELPHWDVLFQTASKLMEKDLRKMEKLGWRDRNNEEGFVESLDKVGDLTVWSELFIEAIEQIVKAMNPDQLDLHTISQQILLSQNLPSWDEIFFIMANYSRREIQERFNSGVSSTLASEENLARIKLLVPHNVFSLDNILLVVIEEFLKDIEDSSVQPEELCSESFQLKNKSVLTLLEEKIKKLAPERKQVIEAASAQKNLKGYSWTDLLPTEEGASRFQAEENLLVTKTKLLHPRSNIKQEKIPDELIWKHIFPLAVLVWRRNMEDYLNFSKMAYPDYVSSMKDKVYPPLFESKNAGDTKRKRADKKVQNPAYEEIDNMEPEFFSISASWREIFFAAVERKKKMLYKLIDLKTINKKESDNKAAKDINKEAFQGLEFSAKNILDSSISLHELFEVTTTLQQKKLAFYSEISDKDINQDNKVEIVKKDNIKAFEVIDIFRNIISNILLERKREVVFLKQELGKLEIIDDKNLKASIALRALKNYYYSVSKTREKENTCIDDELDSLKDLKVIFSGYMDFSSSNSVHQRNKSKIRLTKQAFRDLQMIQNDFERRLLVHLDRCTFNYKSLIDKRNDPRFKIDISKMDVLIWNLSSKDKGFLLSAEKILISIADLRKKDYKQMESGISGMEKRDVDKSDLESKVLDIFNSTIAFLADGLLERNHLEGVMIQAMNSIKNTEESMHSKMSIASMSCKQFFLKTIQDSQTAIEAMHLGIDYLKSCLDCSKEKVTEVEILSTCEGYIKKATENRNLEIQILNKYLKQMTYEQVIECHSTCTKYFLTAIEKRDQEITEIRALMEPLKNIQEDLGTQESSDFDQAMCEVFGIKPGRTFLKIEKEERKSEDTMLNAETLDKFTEFYAKLLAGLHRETKVMKENLDVLNTFEGEIREELINSLVSFIKIMDEEYKTIKMECEMLQTEVTAFKAHQERFLSDVKNILNICQQHITRNLEETLHDIDELKFQLTILSKGESENEETQLENFSGENIFDTDSISISIDASGLGTSRQRADESEDSFPKSSVDFIKILESAEKWRKDFIKSLIDEGKSFLHSENKSLLFIKACLASYFLLGEKRRFEDREISSVLSIHANKENTGLLVACKKCLDNLLYCNFEALNSIEAELDRLTNTVELLQEEKSHILSLCEQDISFAISTSRSEIENINYDLSYLHIMRSTEDAELLSSCKSILQCGIDERKSEVALMKEDMEGWSTDTEILPLVIICGEHLCACLEKRKKEVQNVQERLELLENKGGTSNLLFSPALKAVMENNITHADWLKPEIEKIFHIRKELELKGNRILEACHTLYCNVLETLKIEMEGIVYDIESLKEVQIEKRKSIEAEGKEIIVNFNHLFMTAFYSKKTELEREVRKKVIQDDVNKKKSDMLSSAKHRIKVTRDDIYFQENETDKVPSSDSKSSEGEKKTGLKDVASLMQLINYFDAKKKERNARMKKKVLEKLDDLERNLTLKMVETKVKTSTSSEHLSPEDSQSSDKTETFTNRVYEIKLLEIEEEISLRRDKIGRVIKQRKSFMDGMIKSLRQEIEEKVLSKEKEMKLNLDSITDEDSHVICSLKDLYNDVITVKKKDNYILKNVKLLEKYLDTGLKEQNVLISLETILNVALELKQEEFEILKQSEFKEIKKAVLLMKKEADKKVANANMKLEEELKKYLQHEKSRALEYAGVIQTSRETISEEYYIPDGEIFPDILSFDDFISTVGSPFTVHIKKPIVISGESLRPSPEESAKYIPTHIPFIRPHAYALHGLAGNLLKIYEGEVQSLSKVLYDINTETENAVKHRISLMDEKSSNNESFEAGRKGIHLDLTAVLNTNTSMLMLGSSMYDKCDIALNLGHEFGLAYFEKTENIKIWNSPRPDVKEVSIDIGLKRFSHNDCMDMITTKFDWSATTVPLSSSRFQRFISDSGLLEQMRFAFLELHHEHIFCRNCDITNLSMDVGLTFDDIYKFLNAQSTTDALKCVPVRHGKPSLDDVAVVCYVSKLVLIRGALLTSICLASLLERLEGGNIGIITNSLFIQNVSVYQAYLQMFLSALAPGKTVEFFFGNKRNHGVGAALTACVAFQLNNRNPEAYLFELQARLNQKSQLFSVNGFLKLLKNPETSVEALNLAHQFLKDLKFNLPISVAWAKYFMSEKYEEAEKLFKEHPVSLKQVNFLICQEIQSKEKMELCKMYKEFLKENCTDAKLKVKVYRCLFNMLINRKLYEESMGLIQELMEMGFSLNSLQLSSLNQLRNFWLQNRTRYENVSSFPFALKENYDDSSGSDFE